MHRRTELQIKSPSKSPKVRSSLLLLNSYQDAKKKFITSEGSFPLPEKNAHEEIDPEEGSLFFSFILYQFCCFSRAFAFQETAGSSGQRNPKEPGADAI